MFDETRVWKPNRLNLSFDNRRGVFDENIDSIDLSAVVNEYDFLDVIVSDGDGMLGFNRNIWSFAGGLRVEAGG